MLASHIKPLDKGDNFANIHFDVKWNSVAGKQGQGHPQQSGEIKQKVNDTVNMANKVKVTQSSQGKSSRR